MIHCICSENLWKCTRISRSFVSIFNYGDLSCYVCFWHCFSVQVISRTGTLCHFVECNVYEHSVFFFRRLYIYLFVPSWHIYLFMFKLPVWHISGTNICVKAVLAREDGSGDLFLVQTLIQPSVHVCTCVIMHSVEFEVWSYDQHKAENTISAWQITHKFSSVCMEMCPCIYN